MKKDAAVVGIILAVLIGFAAGIIVKWPPRPAAQAGEGLTFPVKGAKNALITIYEISDFQCPYCARASLETLPKVREIYGDKVNIQFRHNPLSFHKLALPAAKATVAAHFQGRFWEMHDLIFRNARSLSPDKFVTFAGQLGLDTDRFQWDMNDPRVEAFVKADQAASASLGIRGTPMFIINGLVIRGAQPVEKFQEVIDAELQKAEEALAGGTPIEKLAETLSRQNGATDNFVKYFINGEQFGGTPAGAESKKKAVANQ